MEVTAQDTSDDFTGTVIAITGGTGSFGSTMAERLLARGAAQVNVLSRDEAKQDDMRRKFGDDRLRFFLGDVRDASSVHDAFVGADHVFHAAALKQVPSCEFFPEQAVATNVTGSHNVVRAAAAAGARSVVLLSTDKAVYPVNAMGMSKALMEKTGQAFARSHPDSGTVVSITRYGNVMYSRGSVIPLFIDQIRAGKPLTLTEPQMTRFLMSLQDSVELVEYAFRHAQPGDLFVRKAPASTVEVLATAVASLFGVDRPDIRKIGIRHGEKMHETLLSREEMRRAEDHGDYWRVPMDARSLDYELYFEEGETDALRIEDYDSSNTQQLSVEETKGLLLQIPQVREMLAAA